MPAGREDEARRFYADLLGFREVPKPAGLAGRGGCWFASADGQVEVHLGVDPDFRPARKAHPAFVINDLDALHERIAESGADVVDDEAIDVRRFHTADPFGNRIEFTEATADAAGPARFAIGAFGILFDAEDRVLLCHRRDIDLWNLPGGGLRPDEAPWDGVVREVAEETGLEVAVERLAGAYVKPEVGEMVLSFVCRSVGGEPMPTDEADRVEYFALDRLPPNMSRKQAERISDAVQDATHVALKVQRGPSSRKPAGQLGDAGNEQEPAKDGSDG
jgi:ADP-ribose pyrophosphatase YjhB (NUDIX family)/predicted enzyme related to lactoylglutathione lyase